VFSAKGAAFIASLGQRPRIKGSLKLSALKAQFKLCSDAGAELTRAFSAQLVGQSDSRGDAPG
jgi:hypothetical protein